MVMEPAELLKEANVKHFHHTVVGSLAPRNSKRLNFNLRHTIIVTGRGLVKKQL